MIVPGEDGLDLGEVRAPDGFPGRIVVGEELQGSRLVDRRGQGLDPGHLDLLPGDPAEFSRAGIGIGSTRPAADGKKEFEEIGKKCAPVRLLI
jgi:hypothetical protein